MSDNKDIKNDSNNRDGDVVSEDILAEEDDIVLEEDSDAKENTGKDYKEEIRKVKDKLKEAIEEKQKYLDGWQRDKAEFLNVRKRDKEDLDRARKFANESMIEEILPVLQSFDMAFANKEAWEKVDKNWRAGVEYIYNQLKGILEGQGLKEISPLNEQFDPMRDEAMEYVPVEDEKKNNAVIEVIQKGYSLNGKVIRAPKVKVGEFKKA